MNEKKMFRHHLQHSKISLKYVKSENFDEIFRQYF